MFSEELQDELIGQEEFIAKAKEKELHRKRREFQSRDKLSPSVKKDRQYKRQKGNPFHEYDTEHHGEM